MPVPLDGRIPSLDSLPTTVADGDVMYIVSPGNNEQGNSYKVSGGALKTYFQTGLQPLSENLTALSALDATAGLLVQTGAAAFTKRTLVQPAAGITITNPAGTAGNPTFALSDDLAAIEALSGTGIAVRSGVNTWVQRSLVQPAAGITITNPFGISGDFTFALSDDLAAIEALSGTGIARRTGASTWTVGTTVSVAEGGTGATTFTSNGVLYGNGTGAIQVTAQGAANSILTANAGAPSFSAAPVIGTSVTVPLVIGGTGTTGTQLTLQTTTGNGTTDTMAIKGGNNGATTFGTFAIGGLTITDNGSSLGGNGEHILVSANVAAHNAIRISNSNASGFSTLWLGGGNEGFIRYGSSVGNKFQLVASTAGVDIAIATQAIDRLNVSDTQIRITPTTAATSTTDGALRSDGGLSVAGAGVFGGAINTPSFLTVLNTTGATSGGVATAGIIFGTSGVNKVNIHFGSGAPTISANQGSLYLRTDGTTTNNRAYINTNGSTTWTAITTVA